MRVIIQTFSKSNAFGEEWSGPGLILFVSSQEEILDAVAAKCAYKISRLRLWGQWRGNIMEVSKEIAIVPIDGCDTTSLRLALTRLGCFVEIQSTSDQLSFVNSGPCTVILDY
ncbi:hypothetical protein PAEPH01_1888 [Pancytospora epiphaga]|nr:hypothetical protein PAEPH01_1888 [Pancytospora epiphaga]